VLCAVTVGACGGGDDDAQSLPTPADDGGDNGGGDNGGGDNGGGDNGGGGGGGGAPGAPIDIPSFQQDQGRPLDDVLADIEGTVREQCGGDLCIEIAVEMSDDNFTECQFVATDPPQGSQIERGGTLRVIAGTQPCDDGEGTDGEGTDGEGTEGEGTDGEGTDGEGEGTETDGEVTP
jgi:hypothetical protein